MTTNEIYRRFAPAAVDGNEIRGIAVPYNSPSKTLRDIPERGPYREVFQPGSIRNISDSVALYIQHDPQQIPLARVGAGTLRFQETPEGLRFSASLSATRPELIDAIKRGDLPGASIGFRSVSDSWITQSAPPIRKVAAAAIVELSLVVSPAFSGATIAAMEANPNG